MSTCRVCGCNPAYLVSILIVRAFLFFNQEVLLCETFLTNGATRLTPCGGVLLTLDLRRKFEARSEDEINEKKKKPFKLSFYGISVDI